MLGREDLIKERKEELARCYARLERIGVGSISGTGLMVADYSRQDTLRSKIAQLEKEIMVLEEGL